MNLSWLMVSSVCFHDLSLKWKGTNITTWIHFVDGKGMENGHNGLSPFHIHGCNDLPQERSRQLQLQLQQVEAKQAAMTDTYC